ncbi:MAG: Y-family DNA polymerase [Alphaproteobacteria bacterium]
MTDGKTFALVDCNNFFVSCERVFQPHLENRPVMVLSSNDGCIVARSNEVKALGIKMGQPIYQVRDLVLKHDIATFSSNFTLYQDMSRRVMNILEASCPQLEVYSVDEAFLDVSNMAFTDLQSYGEMLRDRMRQWVGMPISVGFGASKTLAKLANHIAKKDPAQKNVYDLTAQPDQDAVLRQINVGDIWGVGRRWSRMLQAQGIFSALDLKQAPPAWVRQRMGVIGARLHSELNGVACIGLDHTPAAKKTTVVSRTFGKQITELAELQEAVATFAANAARKIRRDSQHTGAISVFINTNRFDRDNYYSNSAVHVFAEPCNDTVSIIKAAHKVLESIYKPGHRYIRAGVCLLDLSPIAHQQRDLFAYGQKVSSEQAQLMQSLDQINRRFGRGSLVFGAMGVRQNWMTRCAKRSRHYTSRWDELLRV